MTQNQAPGESRPTAPKSPEPAAREVEGGGTGSSARDDRPSTSLEDGDDGAGQRSREQKQREETPEQGGE